MTAAPEAPRRPAARPCPICSKMSLAEFHPFCSKRCADIDLSRWLKGVYAVPAVETDDDALPPADDAEGR
ncbi:DNA gyrase inhibitor YacG [Methylopila turkensis]|uniref:DNA gyrase inhibitor YacG n=1 Tax=Methylopila turkensis TaxID=1437816 RepID=A0A9W6JP33_9HYPH|nr:DNA gyrase inhibitor YacG [Methylopila turkensis]GLK79709.1 DNA gyrase inhibitor YacG [Methylopila turkensis]